MSSFKIIILIIIFLNPIKCVDYCKLSCGKTIHTICERHGNCNPIKNCIEQQLYDDYRQWIIDAHNQLRNRVAIGEETKLPKAANMHTISYSYELELIARCHVNRCTNKHDQCRRTERWAYVGQNIYMGSHVSTKNDVNSIVQKWYDEIKDLPMDALDKYHRSDPSIGHFTQVIWATTTHVGCAKARNPTGSTYAYMFVCNYGPGGNIVDYPVYMKGEPCSQCADEQCNKVYEGLCGKITLYGNRLEPHYMILLSCIFLLIEFI